MHRLALMTIVSVLFFAQTAGAASPSWMLLGFRARPGDLPAVVKATDKLMSSDVGKIFPGRLLLQQSIANGSNKATHRFVPIYSSAAEREAFVTKMNADPAFRKFLKKLQKHTRPVSQTLFRTVKGWGDINDTDRVWMTHSFRVSDPPAFLSAIERFMSSKTGRKFPGQVYLSAAVAGADGASHLISVGYASEAEMDAWLETRTQSSDWARYLQSSRGVSEYLEGELYRDVKSWGSASLQEITAP